MPKKDTAILMSAGLDSLATAIVCGNTACAGDRVLLLYFTYGSRQQETELHHLGLIFDWLRGRYPSVAWERRVIDIPPAFFAPSTLTSEAWSAEKDTEVKGRNLLFLSIAASIADKEGYADLMAGFNLGLDGNVHADSKPEFVDVARHAILLSSGNRVLLCTPFSNSRKSSAWLVVEKAKAPPGISYSCYSGQPVHCGVCEACTVRRKSAGWGVTDTTVYQN